MIIRIADIPLEWQSDYSDFVKGFECEADECANDRSATHTKGGQ